MGLPCGNRTVLRGGARGDLDTEAVLGGHLGHLGYSSSSKRGHQGHRDTTRDSRGIRH